MNFETKLLLDQAEQLGRYTSFIKMLLEEIDKSKDLDDLKSSYTLEYVTEEFGKMQDEFEKEKGWSNKPKLDIAS